MAEHQLSDEKLRDMHLPELKELAEEQGISGIDQMHKDELVEALRGSSGRGEQPEDEASESERSVTQTEGTKYSQVVDSPEDEPERAGRSLVTTSHEVIRRWAEERGAVPATVPGTRHGDHLGVLRFDFPGYGGGDLEHVSWEEWFRTFDERNLNFIYQEQTSDGSQSNFFRLENPDREDA